MKADSPVGKVMGWLRQQWVSPIRPVHFLFAFRGKQASDRAIRTGVMGGGYVQADETPVDYLEPGHGKTRQGYLWTCNRPGGDVFFRWETSRAAACLDNLIPVDFSGTIQCDGYSVCGACIPKTRVATANN